MEIYVKKFISIF